MASQMGEKALLTAALMLAGCRQIVGIEQRQVFDGDGSLAACNLPTRSEACASCMTTHCCEQSRQCVDPCVSTEQCVYACPAGDSSCRLACSNRWGTVDLAQAKLQLCRDQSCADECGRWDCLGHVQWTVSEHIAETIQISATAKCGSCGPTFASSPLADVHVDVCSTADTGCEVPLASADTGPDGGVHMTVITHKRPVPVFLQFRKEAWLDDLVMLNTPPLSYNFDVGDVYLDQREGVDHIAGLPNTPYSPDRATVKLAVGDCNLRPSDRIDLVWGDPEGATIDGSVEPWNAVAGKLAIDATHATRVVARLRGALANASQDAEAEPIVAVVDLVLRPGAITLAPFVTPTPLRTP